MVMTVGNKSSCLISLFQYLSEALFGFLGGFASSSLISCFKVNLEPKVEKTSRKRGQSCVDIQGLSSVAYLQNTLFVGKDKTKYPQVYFLRLCCNLLSFHKVEGF